MSSQIIYRRFRKIAARALERLLLERFVMQGLITELHFVSAERWFPGIRSFYDHLARKPLTFLELVWEYQRETGRCPVDVADRSSASASRQGR